MVLSEYGEIVRREILKMPEYHPRVIMDEWVIMPDHVHLLIELGKYDFNNGIAGSKNNNQVDKIREFYLSETDYEFYLSETTKKSLENPPIVPWYWNPDYKPTREEIIQYRKERRKMIIPKIIGKMKMLTSKQMNILRNTPGKKNWQHDYDDVIIRDKKSYIRIKNYIINNPKNWNENG